MTTAVTVYTKFSIVWRHLGVLGFGDGHFFKTSTLNFRKL